MSSHSDKVKFVIRDIGVRVDGDWVENPEDYIQFQKLVSHVQFFKDGSAGIWIDITVGNDSSGTVEIETIDVAMENAESTPAPASAGKNHQREIGPDYMWNEIQKLEQSDKGWTTMYTNYEEITHPDLHEEKETVIEDRIFYHELGEDDEQHVFCTPVMFNEGRSHEGQDGDQFYKLHGFKTMISEKRTPKLMPEDEIAEFCPTCTHSDTGSSHMDTITLWAKWEDVNIMRRDDQIEFDFEFQIENKVSNITSVYAYYILPQDGEFIGSKGSDEHQVQIFQPRDTHWMFAAWKDATEITKTGPDNRILRAKTRESSHVYNIGSYHMVERALANDILSKLTLTVIPALLATLLSAVITAYLFSGTSVGGNAFVIILVAIMGVMTIFLFYGIYVTIFGRYTSVSRLILGIGKTIDYIMKVIGKVKDFILRKIGKVKEYVLEKVQGI